MAERRRGRAPWMSLAGGLLMLAALPAFATATHRGSELDQPYLEVGYHRSSLPGVVDQLVAQLRVDDGSAIAGVDVEFMRLVEFLGPRRILLGRATTDAWGTASIPLNVRSSEITVLVLFRGNDSYHQADVTTRIQLGPVSGAPLPRPGSAAAETASLDVISAVMPPLLALAAGAVWLVLLGLTIGTVLAIRRRRHEPLEERSSG